MTLRRDMARMRAALMRVPVPPSEMEAEFMAAAAEYGELSPEVQAAFLEALRASASGQGALSPGASRLLLSSVLAFLHEYLPPDPGRSLAERVGVKPSDFTGDCSLVRDKLLVAIDVANARCELSKGAGCEGCEGEP
jgi:predicted DNA-binding transcriptional regulator YafY